MRDNFSKRVVELLAKRVGVRCSLCGQTTSGPAADPDRAVNLGVASHIKAASPRGPRYDPNQSAADRMSVGNGIWMCRNHGDLIDRDVTKYTVAVLTKMKRTAEEAAARRLEGVDLAGIDVPLKKLRGCQVWSYSRKVTYAVADVVPASHVELTGGRRKLPSVLRWADIQLVYSSADPEDGLTPTGVDEILRDQKNLESSTMCALVLAMWDSTRVIRPKKHLGTRT